MTGIQKAAKAWFSCGKPDLARKTRLACCVTASPYEMICEQLVKAPGKALVYCVDPETGEKVKLYPALLKLDFVCPRGLF